MASPTITTPSTDAEQLAVEIHKNPRKGGIEEYFANSAGLQLRNVDGTWSSFVALEREIPVNWSQTGRLTINSVCNDASGTFALYRDGKNIAEGPCGPGQLNTFQFPKDSSGKAEVLSFTITHATRAEVAAFAEPAAP